MEKNYSVKINTVSKELSAKERIALKDVSNAIKLDVVVTEDKPLVITPDYYAVIDIHNDKSDNKDYKNYIVVDKNGNKYVTGSESFWNAFEDIADEMLDTGEEYSVEVYKLPSKNYTGSLFLTCSIVLD